MVARFLWYPVNATLTYVSHRFLPYVVTTGQRDPSWQADLLQNEGLPTLPITANAWGKNHMAMECHRFVSHMDLRWCSQLESLRVSERRPWSHHSFDETMDTLLNRVDQSGLGRAAKPHIFSER